MRSAPLLALLALLAFPGCKEAEAVHAEAEKHPKKAAGTAKKAKPKPKVEANAHPQPQQPPRYVVPFAWEASQQEPLAQTRSFLREILIDNRVYMEHGPGFFAAFANGQKPRATVITCSDSRVHTQAFDTTPENDDFMIRNIGNQLANSEGSVEYGVEHLATPVLMIMGHTGCGAVKAAMGDISQQSEPVKRELEKLVLPPPKAGLSPDAAWTEAVAANVKSQVATALQHFGKRVQEGQLTVVGAIYDFRNDLGNGPGKLTIIDVNGNSDAERMRAFVAAIESEPESGNRKKDKAIALGDRKNALHRNSSDEAIAGALGKIPGLSMTQNVSATAR